MSVLKALVPVIALLALLTTFLYRQIGTPDDIERVDVQLTNEVPATIYFQPGTERPGDGAGVVLAHGYGGDRKTMDGLARSLTLAGYTVISLDMAGHGVNRNSYRAGFGSADHLAGNIQAGVEFLRGTAGIDRSRIAVAGHSMGGRAALAYGSHHAGVAGLVLIAASQDFLGPVRPRNVLFAYAERELPRIESSVHKISARLAGVPQTQDGKRYGDFESGTAVKKIVIAGTGHGTILSSAAAFDEIVRWIDQITLRDARESRPSLVQAPLGSRLPWFAFLLVLPGLGMLLARVAPTANGAVFSRHPGDPLLLLLVLLATLALSSTDRSGLLLGLSDADLNVSHLALSGILTGFILLLMRRWDGAPRIDVASVVAAVTAWFALVALLGPLSAQIRGMSLTPEKFLLTFFAAALLLPFAVVFQSLLQRDRWWQAMLLRLAARIAIIGVVVAGNVLGVFGFSGTIAVFVLLSAAFTIEPILAAYYQRSRNLVTGASLEALITGWLFVLFLPSNF